MRGEIVMINRRGELFLVGQSSASAGLVRVDLRDLDVAPTRQQSPMDEIPDAVAASDLSSVAPLMVRDNGGWCSTWDSHVRLGLQHLVALTLFSPADHTRPKRVSWRVWLREQRDKSSADRGGPGSAFSSEDLIVACRELAGWGLLSIREGGAESLASEVHGHDVGIRFHRAAARARAAERATDASIVPVYPVHAPLGQPPLALGLVVAYARSVDNGRLNQTFDFRSVCYRDPDQWRRTWQRDGPGVWLFSHYAWSSDSLLELSAAARSMFDAGVTVHGGPNVPSYREDVDAFMRTHRHADVLVHGEGERALVDLLDALIAHGPEPTVVLDPDRLSTVAGITFRTGPDSWVTTTPRTRSADLDEFPSPYLSGLFEEYNPGPVRAATIETNRGCPYGCTFCDWGSATLQRVRLFDCDRVKDEILWCAQRGVELMWIADANFGMFARDVEIIEHLVACRKQYGYPRELIISLAKNHSRHVIHIMQLLEDGGVRGRRTVSLQTTDSHTLEVIRRKNIKLSVFDEIVAATRDLNLTMDTDIMVGNPGSNLAALRRDLQLCIDLAAPANVFRVRMLPNSPMNDPDYKALHQIKVDQDGWLESTASYSADELHEMVALARAYKVFETGAMGRYLLRFLEDELAVQAIELVEFLSNAARHDAGRWPLIRAALSACEDTAVEPVSWDEFYAEVLAAVRTTYRLPDSSGLQAALAAQRAAMPTRGQKIPFTVELGHDVVGYFAARFADRSSAIGGDGVQDPEQSRRRLSDFGPTTLTFANPSGLTGDAPDVLVNTDRELQSDLSRLFSSPAFFSRQNRGW